MDLQFSKKVPVKSYEHVVEQIQSAICDGALKKGDKLPSEMKLKDMFSTSRGTVREALRVLENKGLVSISTGVKGGARVKEPGGEAMRDGMGLLIRHRKVSLGQLAEFREFLEGCAAEKAAIFHDHSSLAELQAIIAEIAAHIETDPDDLEEFHRLDAAFHRQLATMADNPLIEANLQTLHENIHVYFREYIPFSRDLLEDDFQDLCNIAAAVERRDSKSAAELVRRHIAKFNQLMEAAAMESGGIPVSSEQEAAASPYSGQRQ